MATGFVSSMSTASFVSIFSDTHGYMPQPDTPACQTCQRPFSVITRRHHCRNCGKFICRFCSPNRLEMKGYDTAQRVCTMCVKPLMASSQDSSEPQSPVSPPEAPVLDLSEVLLFVGDLATHLQKLSGGDTMVEPMRTPPCPGQGSTSCLGKDMVEAMKRCEACLLPIAELLRQSRKPPVLDLSEVSLFLADLAARLQKLSGGDTMVEPMKTPPCPGQASTSCLRNDMVEAMKRCEACLLPIAESLQQAKEHQRKPAAQAANSDPPPREPAPAPAVRVEDSRTDVLPYLKSGRIERRESGTCEEFIIHSIRRRKEGTSPQHQVDTETQSDFSQEDRPSSKRSLQKVGKAVLKYVRAKETEKQYDDDWTAVAAHENQD